MWTEFVIMPIGGRLCWEICKKRDSFRRTIETAAKNLEKITRYESAKVRFSFFLSTNQSLWI